MSIESKTYQIVFLCNLRDLENDRSYKDNVISCVLKLLTFYTHKVKRENKTLQWGFSYYDKHSSFSYNLPISRFRDFTQQSFELFENGLEKISQALLENPSNDCPRCGYDNCLCDQNVAIKPRVKRLNVAFTDVLGSFPWDCPDISSPVKRISSQRFKGSHKNSFLDKKLHTRGGTNDALVFDCHHQQNTNILFLLSKCPHSNAEVCDFIGENNLTLKIVKENILPDPILREIRDVKKIAAFWIDTTPKKSQEDHEGLCSVASSLLTSGGVISLEAILGSQNLSGLDKPKHESSDLGSVSGDVLPVSSVFSYYLLQTGVCQYGKPQTNAVHLQDTEGQNLMQLQVETISMHKSDRSQEELGSSPSNLTVVGSVSLRHIPLGKILPHPVYSLTESLDTESHGAWEQLLLKLASSGVVMVVECDRPGPELPVLGVVQALSSLSASLSLIDSTASLTVRKTVLFKSVEFPKQEIDGVDDLMNRLNQEGCSMEEALPPPAGCDKFQPGLLEPWVIPAALPCSMAGLISPGELAEEEKLLAALQKAYIRHKSRRLNNLGSTPNRGSPGWRNRSSKQPPGSPIRRSPRKHKAPQQAVRQSPRKAVRQASSKAGLVHPDSFVDRKMRKRSKTAPTSRKDLILQNSRVVRDKPREPEEKRPGRRSNELPENAGKSQAESETVPSAETVEELLPHLQMLRTTGLDGQSAPSVAATKISVLLAGFCSLHPEVVAVTVLKQGVLLTASEVSKTYLQQPQQARINESLCQIWLWMEVIHHHWVEDDEAENALQQVVMLLRSLSFLQDPGALNTHLTDLLQRYEESLPMSLLEIYEELGQPLPPPLQGLVSPGDLDSTLPSQPPDSALSFVESEYNMAHGVPSHKDRAKKINRHSSFHVAPQRQIKLNVGKNSKASATNKRRSARIASTTKVKRKAKDLNEDDAKVVRRNLFSEGGGLSKGGIKLERRQSVAVMETRKRGDADNKRNRHKPDQEVSRRSSLVSETPVHKQKPNQLWERQEMRRQRSQTVAPSVTVVEESPHKPIPQRLPKSAAPLYRRTSFYSNIPEKQSRSMKLVEKRMEKLEARLTDPKRSCSSLTITTPKRRIHHTFLFGNLMSPSPQKPVHRRTESSSPAKRGNHTFRTPKKSEMGSCSQPASSGVDFSSPCKNTRAQMRLFQSPSPKKPTEMLTKCVALQFDKQNTTPRKLSLMSPMKKVSVDLDFMSPSKNTRLQSWLFSQSPLKMTPRKGSMSIGGSTPVKSVTFSDSCTPVKKKSPHGDVFMPDFSSPSKNTRSHSKLFQPPIQNEALHSRVVSSAPRRQQTIRVLGNMNENNFNNPFAIFRSSEQEATSSEIDNKKDASSPAKVDTAQTPSKNTRSRARLFQSPPLGTQSLPARLFQSPPPGSENSSTAQSPVRDITNQLIGGNTKKELDFSAFNQKLHGIPNSPLASDRHDSPSLQRRVSNYLTNSQQGGRDSISALQQIDNNVIRSPRTPRGKRKLCLNLSPEDNDGTPTKRHRSSVTSPLRSTATRSLSYLDTEEVFVKINSPRKSAISMFSDIEPLRNPSVEILKHQSSGSCGFPRQHSTESSSIPSPIFPSCSPPGLLTADLSMSSPGSPESPVFDMVSPKHNKPVNTTPQSENKAPSCGTHFSPHISKGSITQLVKSPLLESTKKQPIRQSPRKSCGPFSPHKGRNENRMTPDTVKNVNHDHAPRKGNTPTGGKIFSRKPTKLSL